MKRVMRIVLLVACGVVGAWVGYWLGYLAGWSKNAEWPGTIGGGTGAILVSIGMSVLFVAVAGLLVFLLPQRGIARVLASGSPAKATVVSAAKTGGRRTGRHGTSHQVSCELDVCLPDGSIYRTRATQFVAPGVEQALRPGATLAVRYDPVKPRKVAIVGPSAS